MALVVKDRVRETTTTTGTGTVTLGGAVLGFQTFAVIGDGNTTYYAIVDSTSGAWEVGVGTYTASGTSLSRDTVFESSNAGALVPFGAGTKDVFCTYPAERSIYTDAAGSAITPATASILGVVSGGTGLSTLATNRIPYGNNTSAFQSSASLTFDGTTLTTNTVDATNLEVTNIKAKDGTAAASIADSTGIITVSTQLAVDNLNLSGNTLSSTDTNGNVTIAPNGTGDVQLDADTVRIGDSNANATLTTNGTGDLILNTNGGTNSGTITIEDGINGNIILAPNGTGQVQLGSVIDVTTIEVTNVKAKDGTASATIADTTGYWTFSGTGAFTTPKGNNTTERPGTPVTGMLRYNTTSNEFEGYSGASPSWKSVGGAAITNDTSTASDLYPTFVSATTGTASTLNTSNAKLLYKPSTGELKVSAPVASNGILVNATTMAANYTIDTGTNGLSVGPFTINSGVTLTIASGQRHLIL